MTRLVYIIGYAYAATHPESLLFYLECGSIFVGSLYAFICFLALSACSIAILGYASS